MIDGFSLLFYLELNERKPQSSVSASATTEFRINLNLLLKIKRLVNS